MSNEHKKYNTIMADCPWPQQQSSGSKAAVKHYPVMELKKIRDMPIADLAASDAHLWLWTTAAALRDSYGVMEAWGFTPRSIFCWCKPRLGLGKYLRNSVEFALFGTRGKAPILFRSQPNWLFAPVQDHSHKPEEQYAIIERCSPGPYLELFARRKERLGWNFWGNEIESDIEIPGYPVPKYRKTEGKV